MRLNAFGTGEQSWERGPPARAPTDDQRRAQTTRFRWSLTVTHAVCFGGNLSWAHALRSQADVETPTDRELRALMARCTAAGDDVAAWRELRDRMAALASTGGAIAALARSIENLLSGMLEGTVADLARAMELVAEACAALRLATPGRSSAGEPGLHMEDERLVDLVERLDAFSSGMPDVVLDELASASAAHEPPVLTEREDGTRVTLARFDDEPAQVPLADAHDSVSAWPTDASALPSTVDTIVEAMNALVARLYAQSRTLQSDPAIGQVEDARHALAELANMIDELAVLTDALAGWSVESAALLGESTQ